MKPVYFIILISVVSTIIALGQGSPSNLPSSKKTTSQSVIPTPEQNYIVNYTYLEPKDNHSSTYLAGETAPEVQYFDGLGRLVETIKVKASQAGSDIVGMQTYDSYGRLTKQYLHYPKGTTNKGIFVSSSTFTSGQSSFLSGIYGASDGTKGYSETSYENNPLNRIAKKGAAGVSWQVTANPKEYTSNTNASAFSSWKYTGSSYSTISYAKGTLFLKQSTDEDNHIVKEYTDNKGKLVRMEKFDGTFWLITHYCYDDLELLRCVIQPMGSSPASTNYCFYYKYDDQERLTDKYVPGSGWINYIYDARDRLVLSQDSNQRDKSPDEWSYIIYESLNRPVEQGVWSTSTSRITLTSNIASNIDYIKTYATTRKVQKKTQYDNYTGMNSAYNLHSDASILSVTEASDNTKRVTSETTYLLDNEADMTAILISVFRYDKYGRVIQTISDNHLGGKDYFTNKYNFTGQFERTYHRHVVNGITTILDKNFDYDHRGRLMKNRIKIGTGTETLLSAYSYDEVGEMVDKYLHSQSGGNFLQRQDYQYNIRGWLTHIDNPASFTENDKFGLQLYYNTAPTGGAALFNGNIAGMKWGTPTNPEFLYRYLYDGNNRLTGADFDKSWYGSAAMDCSYLYDKNGNFTNINRRNLEEENIDKLVFAYNGNQIDHINDIGEGDYYGVDYPGSYLGSDFDYDGNGNITYHPDKEISFKYNQLNLPREADFGSNQYIYYFYNFDGKKLRKKVENNGTVTKVDYCGPFVYETTGGVRSLKYFITSEGRAVKNGSNWDYEYNLKDHLGNTRVVIHKGSNGLAEQIQERNYYPFGMEVWAFSTGSSTNQYLYNNKEYQNDFDLDWYDYGARFYDPALARFTTIDPLSEDYYSLSPYGYCAGNPIAYRDENGEWINFVVGAVVGAATDYALQVATNYVEGKTGAKAWTEVDGSSISVSAVAGATGVGIATKIGKAMKVAKMAEGMKTAITVGGEVATDAAASATNQLVTTGEVDLKDVAIDATAGQIVGKTVSKAVQDKAQASKTAKVLHNQADRAQRVAKGSREVRQVAADKATQKAESYGVGRATAAGTASSGTASKVVKELDDKNNQ